MTGNPIERNEEINSEASVDGHDESADMEQKVRENMPNKDAAHCIITTMEKHQVM